MMQRRVLVSFKTKAERMRTKIAALAILPLFSFLTIRAAPQRIELKNGLRLVHNEKIGAWGVTPKVRLELVRTIGGLNVEDEHLAFKDPTDTAMDSKGCIYILDRGNEESRNFRQMAHSFSRSVGTARDQQNFSFRLW
jgi:hypothetical protein